LSNGSAYFVPIADRHIVSRETPLPSTQGTARFD